MTLIEVIKEITKITKIKDALLECVQDSGISSTGRKQYYSDYLEAINYLLKLESQKLKLELKIV